MNNKSAFIRDERWKQIKDRFDLFFAQLKNKNLFPLALPQNVRDQAPRDGDNRIQSILDLRGDNFSLVMGPGGLFHSARLLEEQFLSIEKQSKNELEEQSPDFLAQIQKFDAMLSQAEKTFFVPEHLKNIDHLPKKINPASLINFQNRDGPQSKHKKPKLFGPGQ